VKFNVSWHKLTIGGKKMSPLGGVPWAIHETRLNYANTHSVFVALVWGSQA
jgi:hypothetical protein